MAPVVAFDGSKCFWKTKNTVDILIIEHDENNSVEIIAYEPTFNKESPRIYLDKNILTSKIDPSFVDGKLRHAKEQCLRRHQVPDVLHLLHEINQKARVDYILNRLFITEFVPESKTMILGIQFNFRDRDEEQDSSVSLEKMITTRPADLVPFVSPHHETLMVEMVNDVLRALEEEKESIRQLRATADIHEAKARALLGIRERWRIPIVMKKVASGRRLSVSDAKIWNVVSKRLALTENCDIAQVIESAIASGVPVQSAEAGTSTAVLNTAPLKPVFTKQKTVKRSMVPAALFSQTSNAAIIKEATAPAVSNTAKAAMPQRSAAQKSSKVASGAALSGDVTATTGGGFSAGFSAVATSFKKHLGLSKSATTSKLPVPVQSSVPEKDEHSNSNRSVSTARLYRSSTAGSANPEARIEQAATTPVSRSTKPGVPKFSPPSLKIQTSIVNCATAAPSPMSTRFAATLTTLSESFRNSFSFKRNNTVAGAADDDMLVEDTLLPTGEVRFGLLQPTESYKEELEADKTPVLTRRPSLEQDTTSALGQEDSAQANASSTSPDSEILGSPRLKLPQKLSPHASTAVPANYRPANAASASADSVTPRSLAEYKNKQAAGKHARSDAKPEAKLAVSPKPVAAVEHKVALPSVQPAPAARGWLTWNSQKKIAVPVEAGAAAITPRNSSSAVAPISPENSHNTARAAQQARAAVSYQELVVKRQQQADQGGRGEAKSSGRKAPNGALRQIWSSLLGSQKQKVTPVE